MGITPWIIIAITAVLILLGLLVYFVTKKKKSPPDYYAFFVIGICWLPMGIALGNYAFSVMGAIFMILGLYNKDKWKQNRKSWGKMDPGERKLMLIVMLAGVVALLVGLVVFYLFKKGIL